MKDTIKIGEILDYFGWKEADRRVAWITHFQCCWPCTGLVHMCDRSRGAAHVPSTARTSSALSGGVVFISFLFQVLFSFLSTPHIFLLVNSNLQQER